jgi:hypothetical protein
MASSFSGTWTIKGQGIPFLFLRQNNRVGPIQFQVKGYQTINTAFPATLGMQQTVSYDIYESFADGTQLVRLSGNNVLNPGGVSQVNVSSAKSILTLASSSGNSGVATVMVQVNYAGIPYGGDLHIMEESTTSGFTGPQVPWGNTPYQ